MTIQKIFVIVVNMFFFTLNASPQQTIGNDYSLHKGHAVNSSFTALSEKYSPGIAAEQTISLLRPRLFVRADKSTTGRGLTLSQLRSKIKDPAYREWIAYDEPVTGWESATAKAMVYLLKKDKKTALDVGKYLAANSFPFHEHTSTAAAVYFCAIAFDWVREALPAAMAKKISDRLAVGAEYLKEGVTSPAVNHNYTIVSMHAVSMAAIAIYGEGKENTKKSLEYMNMINHLLTGDNMLMETFKQKEGVWGEGNHYSPFVVYYPFLMTLRGLTTATSADYFDKIITRYDNFIKPMSKFVMANFRPDFTQERIGDRSERVVPRRTFMRPLIELLASEINDPELQGQVSSFSKQMANYYGSELVPPVYRWMMLVNFDAALPDTPSYKTLPLQLRLGKNAYEHIMFRNSWEDSATQITYLSGDHYTDHQHLDKGQFLIYKKGGLAIDGGGYMGMYNDFWSNYSTRTIAHNNVLIYDPAEVPFKSVEDVEIYPDGGQKIIRGAQSHKNWPDYLDIRKQHGMNTADVLAFGVDSAFHRYDYIKSNLSVAYGDKTIWTDRQLVYLPLADYLLIRDRVITKKPLDKYWLLHFQEAPKVDGKIPATGITDYLNDSIVSAYRTDSLKLDGKTIPYSGGLLIKSLLPANRTISIIGGPGYEYYNRFANKNFPPEKPFAPFIEAGKWRMEVKPSIPSTKTVFLHALEITGAYKKEMVPVIALSSKNNIMDGALFLSKDTNYVVLFSSSMDERGNDFQKAVLPVSYAVKTLAPAHHILTEMEAGRKANVIINGQSIGVFNITDAGILSFTDKEPGIRNIDIKAE